MVQNMTIQIGRGVQQQNSILRPMNSGMGHIARDRLVQYIGMQNEKQAEAIKVDGVPTEIWIKQSGGRVCSCMSPEIHTTNYVGDKNPEHVKSNPFDFKVNSPNDIDTKVRYVENDVIEENILTYDKNTDWIKEFDLNPNNPSDLLDNENNVFKTDDVSLLFGGTRSACGICFGTGFTDAYQLINGKRIVLDSTYEHIISGGFIDTETKPYTFNLASDINSFVLFEVEVPLYFKAIHNFRLLNNCVPIYGCILVSPDNKTYKPLGLDVLNSYKGKFNKIYIKVLGDFKRELKFTHLELNYELADFPLIDYPPFARQENFQYFEALQTTNFEVNGNVPYIDRECVFGEMKTGYLWRAVSATQHMDNRRQLFKTEVEARLIQRSEALYMLNSVYRPMLLYNYRGLERIQGLSNYIDRTYRNIEGI